jgi:Ca2+-binding RTX toxin-like protein
MDASGDFVVTWTSYDQDGSGSGVYAQRYQTDMSPTQISLSKTILAENAGVDAVVGELSGTDPDANSTLTFSLPTVAGDNALFNVSGSILQANDSFDFERKSSYVVTVRVTDQFGLTYDKAFTITVTNVIGDRDYVVGTDNNDAFVLTYSSTSTNGTVNVMRSTNGGAVIDLGTFPMNAPVTLKGLAGTDSVRVIGTAGTDKYVVSSSGRLTINGAGLVLNSIDTTTLAGMAGDDLYRFDADTALGVYTLDEAGGGIDTVDLSLTTTSGVAVNLGSAIQQVVNSNLSLKLSSSTVFEKAIGGSGNDTLTGNSLANTLTGNGGNDRLNGGSGNDSLVGGLGDDTYVFASTSKAEADTVTEAANRGTDTLSFSTLTTDVILSLGTTDVQTVQANRTLKLNSASVFENIAGGSGNDTLTGNLLANILVGNAGRDTLNGSGGRDILIGGLGLDTLNGGEDEDILISGRTTSDALFSNLNRVLVEWVSVNSYATRITNLRAGVGSPAVSLKAKVNVLNDAGEFDSLVGGNGTDWYFGVLYEVVTGLVTGEIRDVL